MAMWKCMPMSERCPKIRFRVHMTWKGAAVNSNRNPTQSYPLRNEHFLRLIGMLHVSKACFDQRCHLGRSHMTTPNRQQGCFWIEPSEIDSTFFGSVMASQPSIVYDAYHRNWISFHVLRITIPDMNHAKGWSHVNDGLVLMFRGS